MSLTANYTFVGKGNWSIDGAGGQASGANQTLSAIVPDGSRIEAAFLYTSTYSSSSPPSSVTLTRGSDSATITSYTGLGATAGLQAFRSDITTFIREAIDDGGAGTFDFDISDIVGSSIDGYALVVVYSNPGESVRTISLLDGFSATTGDDFELEFSEPVDTDRPGFEAQMSLGIGFSFWPSSQFSRVTVDGRQLTQSAGAQDDGTTDFSSIGNGGLLTIGGIGDSTGNPDPDQPINGVRTDDELYDLAKGNVDDATPYLADNAESITVNTVNPSNDDNIFFAGFNITAVVAVDTDENDAPVAVGDEVAVDEDDTATFNVLGNDFDPDDDDTFSITSIDTSGLVGTLTDNGAGGFTYDPNGEFDALNEGDEATTSFTYTISDGEESATTTVTITVRGVGDDGPPPPSGCPTVDRPGTQDGSASANEVLTGPGYHNTFFFDNAGGSTGDDRITNFAKDDVLVVTERLVDRNNDGVVNFGGNALFDLGGGDTVRIDGGVRALRYLGEACEGNFVYADASVRPNRAREGFVLSDDVLSGDAMDARADIFFFDTALDLDLGDDRVVGFGARDILVTTTPVFDSDSDGVVDFGGNGRLDLPGGLGGPGDPGAPGEGGSVRMTNVMGGQITRLEFDGAATRNGVTYYVYSALGSDAGVDDLGPGYAPVMAPTALMPML
ncbi:Ig-like domain-containing protein [Sphingomonas lenta]|uniref:Cadherin domain-containing protein n=1 Tax=Sphingomonas lenta TaxID=1141887 RepID=A0A2A2SJJ8_9SPHN|nr:Ig-like domain-containing protein [Sphingomonas lenta]PAX09395.1 hypothetical protein CKY28_01170 [Sphingomonas lenta]